MADLRYWIALSMLPDVGPVGAGKLLSVFGTPERIFDAKMKDLLAVEGIGTSRAKSIAAFSLWGQVEGQIRVIEREGIQAVHIGDPVYPELLREIADPPVVVYVRGDIRPQDKYAVAVVGSRSLTYYGRTMAERISEDLAHMGFTIVSGMARGVDSLSHGSAIKAGGRTIAVLGSGVDVPYPPENRPLMDRIAKEGYVLSELPPGSPPDKENFPKRNRLISGLSLGIVVVEATSRSGALITARYALEQGREVFAVPGNVTSANSEGTNELIGKGASLTRNADDILGELAPVLKGFIRPQDKVKIEVTEEEGRLCNLLSGEPKQVDVISRESGLPASKVLAVLLGLELKGAVKQITGKRFYLV